MSSVTAERTAAFLLERVTARWGRMWDQGACPAGTDPPPGHPALAVFARRRVRGVPEAVARGLGAWAQGERAVDLLERIPAAEEVLHLQTRGRRCVSLLPDEAARAKGDPRHPDGLTFALHDLCHLEKFVDPEHHRGQVGFFAAVARALASPAFQALEFCFDDLWFSDRNYVISDMNGSAIFLFAVLKMRLKVAVRRALARDLTSPAAPSPLSALQAEDVPPADRERVVFPQVITTFAETLGLPPELHPAAHLVSTRRDHPPLARQLLAYFEASAVQSGPLGESRSSS